MASLVPPAERLRRVRHIGRVLIIDDNADLVDTLRGVLLVSDRGAVTPDALRFEVVTAASGAEGQRLAEEHGFDVAIVDVKLPDTSGVDLIRPLRSASPFGEIVLITGFATMDAAMAALRAGAFAFLPKSFRPEELISTVGQALTKSRLEREREELERRYRSLVELTDVLVVGLDEEGSVVLFNRRAAALTGTAAEDVQGRDFVVHCIPAEDRARLREAIAHVRAGSRTREIESGFCPDVGAPGAMSLRRIRWHLSSAKDGVGEEDVVYGIGIDVTERRSLEKRAADAEAMSAMGSIALSLAHEIRNPLNAAVLQLNMLNRQIGKLQVDMATKHALHKRVGIVEGEIGRLNRLLSEFLELSRPRELGREPVHVGTIVDEVLDLEFERAKAREISFVRELSADGCVALGDREKLKQVVINLIVNAIEAMKDGGTLSAKVTGDGDYVRILIEDTGPGIPIEHLGAVFDPFFTTKEGGTGLGLSIVRKIVEQHGGEVVLDSERGAGTRVLVRVPLGR